MRRASSLAAGRWGLCPRPCEEPSVLSGPGERKSRGTERWQQSRQDFTRSPASRALRGRRRPPGAGVRPWGTDAAAGGGRGGEGAWGSSLSLSLLTARTCRAGAHLPSAAAAVIWSLISAVFSCSRFFKTHYFCVWFFVFFCVFFPLDTRPLKKICHYNKQKAGITWRKKEPVNVTTVQ